MNLQLGLHKYSLARGACCERSATETVVMTALSRSWRPVPLDGARHNIRGQSLRTCAPPSLMSPAVRASDASRSALPCCFYTHDSRSSRPPPARPSQTAFRSRIAHEKVQSARWTERAHARTTTRSDRSFLYGTNAVLAALTSRRRHFYRLMMMADGADKRILHEATAAGVSIDTSYDRHALNRFSDDRPHNGVVLECSNLDLPSLPGLGSTAERDRPGFVILLDEVSDPQNLGSILRSAYFLGCEAVVLSERNCSPVTSAVAKVSSGACEFLDMFRTTSATEFLRESRRNGWRTLAAVAHSDPGTQADASTLSDESICLVLGSEGSGIRTLVRRECTRVIGVAPAAGISRAVDSLNVGSAAAVLISRITAGRRV